MAAVECANRACQGCGGQFVPRRPNQSYCDGACKQRAYRLRSSDPWQLPADLAELAWEAAGGDALCAIDAALKILDRLEQARAAA